MHELVIPTDWDLIPCQNCSDLLAVDFFYGFQATFHQAKVLEVPGAKSGEVFGKG
jgi:hypothetical protein